MGCWGVGVMEGDTPMDIEYCIRQELIGADLAEEEAENDDDSDRLENLANSIITKALSTGRYGNIIKRIKSGNDDELMVYDADDVNIALQVLGEMIMCYGGTMSNRTRGTFRKAARDDAWAQEDDERKEAMDAFIVRITNFVNGTCVEPTSQGLMGVIMDHMASGKPGMVNR